MDLGKHGCGRPSPATGQYLVGVGAVARGGVEDLVFVSDLVFFYGGLYREDNYGVRMGSPEASTVVLFRGSRSSFVVVTTFQMRKWVK